MAGSEGGPTRRSVAGGMPGGPWQWRWRRRRRRRRAVGCALWLLTLLLVLFVLSVLFGGFRTGTKDGTGPLTAPRVTVPIVKVR